MRCNEFICDLNEYNNSYIHYEKKKPSIFKSTLPEQ